MTSERDMRQAGPGGHEGDAALFAAELFAGVQEGRLLPVFTLPNRLTRFVRSEIEAVTAVEMLRPSCDVYVGVGTLTRDLGPHTRGGADDIAGLTGLYADIDYLHPAHAGRKNYPPDQESALALVAAMPAQPTMLVHSGHGIQPWWLFEEAYEPETAAERLRLQETLRGWISLLAEKAAARGWDLDPVHDLARVLRFAGTWNRKIPSDPKPVRLLSVGGPRYGGPGDFEEWVSQVGLGSWQRRRGVPLVVAGMALYLDPNAVPPFEKFQALYENDRRFVLTWERRRPDLADQSASAYDLALANAATAAGWTDQETADLLIACRRKHGDDLKLREDYYARTISRARQTNEQRAALSQILTTGAGPRTDNGSGAGHGPNTDTPGADTRTTDAPDSGPTREQVRQNVSRALGLEVSRWLQHNSEQSRYTLVLADGREVAIGSVEAVTSITRFNNAVVQALGRSIPAMKRDVWWGLVDALGQLTELIETIDATRRGTLRDWLRSYLADTREEGRGEQWRVIEQQLPFYDGGDLWIHARSLRAHVVRVMGEQIEMADLTDMLREAGFTRKHRAARVPEERRNGRPATVNLSYWHAPRTVMDEPGGDANVSA